VTQDEIIDMAKQAWADAGDAWVAKEWFDDRAKAFETFAKLVAAKATASEREACAKLLESRKTGANELMDAVRDMEAKAIRARGELESQEQNFCPRCGKRTNDIHTCTPPQEKNT